MDTKQLDDALIRLFVDDGERIVFWHDPAHEFLDFMDRLPFLTFGDTTVIAATSCWTRPTDGSGECTSMLC